MPKVFVQHSVGHDIAVFDEGDGYRELGRISLGRNIKPDYVFLSKDERLLYANWSDLAYREPGFRGPAQSWFTAHDTTTFAEVWRADLVSAIGHFAMDPTGRYAWSSVTDRPQVIRVDVETQQVDYVAVTSLGGHGVKVAKDGKRVYVGSIMTADLWEIDTQALKLTRLFGFPAAVRPFALTPDGKYALVQNSHLHGFHILDLHKWEIERTIELPPNPPDTPKEIAYPFTVDHGITISPDQKYVFILATTANDVYVLDYPSFTFRKKIKVGVEPSYLIFNPGGDRLYVTSRQTDEVHVIDTQTHEIVAHIANTGDYPQRICVSR